MKYRKFGRTGIEVSDIAPGLWGMGGTQAEDVASAFPELNFSIIPSPPYRYGSPAGAANFSSRKLVLEARLYSCLK